MVVLWSATQIQILIFLIEMEMIKQKFSSLFRCRDVISLQDDEVKNMLKIFNLIDNMLSIH